MDWAQKLIVKIRDELVDNDATRAFCEAYKDGDSVEACQRYTELAEREEIFEPNTYVLRIFKDGSCDADWNGPYIDRFYDDLNDLINEDEEVAERFEE